MPLNSIRGCYIDSALLHHQHKATNAVLSGIPDLYGTVGSQLRIDRDIAKETLLVTSHRVARDHSDAKTFGGHPDHPEARAVAGLASLPGLRIVATEAGALQC